MSSYKYNNAITNNMEKTININLRIWRQRGPKAKGAFESYKLDGVSTDSSFLEMLDQLNEQLISEGKEPIVFDHDCREGICGCAPVHQRPSSRRMKILPPPASYAQIQRR